MRQKLLTIGRADEAAYKSPRTAVEYQIARRAARATAVQSKLAIIDNTINKQDAIAMRKEGAQHRLLMMACH